MEAEDVVEPEVVDVDDDDASFGFVTATEDAMVDEGNDGDENGDGEDAADAADDADLDMR